MLRIQARPGDILSLGRCGENKARQIIFNLSRWQGIYGPGTVQLLAQRPGEKTLYPVSLDTDDDHAVWTVNAADVGVAGRYGRCELLYYVGDTIVKSEIWSTIVSEAIDGPVTPAPEPEENWVSQVLQAGTDAQEAAQRAEEAAIRQPIVKNGTWWTWDADAGQYVDSGEPAQGPIGPMGPAPERGVDYWTSEDQEAIVEAVLATLPDAEEVNW